MKVPSLRVSLAIISKSNAIIILYMRNVFVMMTGNATYPDPNPDLKTVGKAIDLLETLVGEALNGGKSATAARNAQRVVVVGLIRQLVSYVQNLCGNDMTALLSSGFEATKQRTPVGKLSAPARLQLTQKGTGILLLRVTKVANAVGYTVEISSNSDGPWESRGLSTSTRIQIAGLTAGKVYWVRVTANGSAGPSDYAGPISAMAL